MTSALEQRRDGPEVSEIVKPDDGDALVGDSLAGSIWTGVSRITGFMRAATIAAILGATYFGNTFQALNSLPNLVYYQLLAGSLFASVLVPMLVRHLGEGDTQRAKEILTGFLGTMVSMGALAAGLLFVGGWLVLQLMAAGVSDGTVAAAQRHVGFLLLVVFVPQVALYVLAGVGAAAMNAKGRFALAAGAPAVENLVIILFLVASVVAFGSETDITKISDAEALLLGLGATLAVACHAGLQCWGAHRVGMSMRPRFAWHDRDVRQIVRNMGPALAYTSLAFLQVVAFLIAANRVAGGVVALQLALNFFYLPLALVAWPIARALLPQLARRKAQHAPQLFVHDLRRAVALASFVAIPITIGYLALSYPLARVIAFGEIGPDSVRMLALSIAAIAPGVLVETWFILGTYASYAREDMRTPIKPMGIRVGTSIALMLLVTPVTGDFFLPLLGLALSLGSFAGALRMTVLVRRKLAVDSKVATGTLEGPKLRSTMLRSLVASLLMVAPAWCAAFLVDQLWNGKAAEIMALALAILVCIVVFVGTHALLRSPELDWIRSSILPKRIRPDVDLVPG
jgi:putative peptidoglycan lipid II flippase